MTIVPDTGRSGAFDRFLGRLLIVATYVAVALLTVGSLLLISTGVSPLAGGPPLDLGRLAADLLALDPAAFLWLGILAVIATPVSRVVVSTLEFTRRGDWTMLGVALGILIVIAIGVVSAAIAGG